MSTPSGPSGPSAPPGAATVSIGWAVLAGVVTGLVGFTSSFAVVLTGLRAVGASTDQAASGLLVLCVTMGLGCVVFSWRTRTPITLAWSTPGAALLATAAVPHGGFPAAVGAFMACGVLLALCGLVRPLGRVVAMIPAPLANGMLAGVLLVLCAAPFLAVAEEPAAIAPVILAWLVLMAVARRWAVPGALVAAIVVLIVSGTFGELAGASLVPVVEFVAPQWDAGALLAIAVPLFIVTMTSQNIPGIAVLAGFGYRPDMRAPLTYAGTASVAGALGGGHAINLAAISAALAAGPEAHPDPDRRWVAGVSCGFTYLAFGPLSALVTAVAVAAPAGLVETIAGLALLATLAGAAAAALGDTEHREAAAITIVVSASGLVVAGIGAAFWGLVAGAAYLLLIRLAARGAIPIRRR
ncbi:benzoate/H(+) symporter BenE family transporter [Nocardioides sp. AE5]|uniref:benzoate/H(+) symporter BenE family transporter n=1 Tax=Nocardioides sp. AE5 TaxID=2962573 RepID=UPI002881959A|nr:benzoate/H(+) symporter BenE family transporter [Nocardioides sp. AE5]MDT0202928.1 benzoate/H(+) symporter BenE family transporter [Nocardioides sp. AE5]